MKEQYRGPGSAASVMDLTLAEVAAAKGREMSADVVNHPVSVHPGRPPLSRGLYLSYGIGMIGDRVFGYTPALLLLVFMTNYLAIPAALAGTAIFIPKVVVVFIDPLVGILSDRLRTRWGRRRPLMFAGAILTGASFIALFYVPRIEDVWWRTAYMSLMISLGFAAYSLYSVPYLSMASEMTSAAAERTKLMSVRVAFMAVGLSIGAFAGVLVDFGGGGISGYRFLAVVFGAICLATMMVTVIGTGRAPKCDPDCPRPGLLAQFLLARRDGRYLLLLLVNLLQKIGEGVGLASFAYFIVYFIHQSIGAIGPIIVGTLTGQILSQPFWIWLNGRLSRPLVYTLGIALWIAMLGVWLRLPDAPLWQLVLMGVWSGISAGGILSGMLMMLADTLSADAERGMSREGTYSGIWLATEKIGLAVGAALVGVVLQLFHFVSTTQGMDAAQPAGALLGIPITYVALTSLLYASSLVPVWRATR